MKSALPKVLHPVAGRPMVEHVVQTAELAVPGLDHRCRRPPGGRRSGAPGRPAGHSIRPAGAAARNRPRAAAGRAAAGRTDRHGGAALGRRAPAEGGDAAPSSRSAPDCQGGRDGGYRHRSNALTATAASSGLAAGSPGSWRSAMRRRRSGESRKSTAASTRSTWPRCSTRLRAIAATERPGRVLPDRPDCRLPAAEAAGGNRHGGGPRRDSRGQQPQRTGRSERDHETEQERGTDGRGRHHRRPGHHLHRPGRRGRSRHGDSPGCGHPGTDPNRLGLRNPGATCALPTRNWPIK